jgi:hypothetical protein
VTVTAKFPRRINAPFAVKMIERVSPMTGEHAFILQGAYTGSAPCTARGYPTVSFSTADGRVLGFHYSVASMDYCAEAPSQIVYLSPVAANESNLYNEG